MKEKEKYDVKKHGYRIRGDADFNRLDMNKSQRQKLHRKKKLLKKEFVIT